MHPKQPKQYRPALGEGLTLLRVCITNKSCQGFCKEACFAGRYETYHISSYSANILFPGFPATAQVKLLICVWQSSLLQQGRQLLLSCLTAMQATQTSVLLATVTGAGVRRLTALQCCVMTSETYSMVCLPAIVSLGA